MKALIKNRINSIFIIAAILLSIVCVPVYAVPAEEEITSLSASYASGKVTVTGETIENVYAVAIMIYNNNELLRMETFAVINQRFTAEIQISLSAGTYTVKAADYAGGPFATTTFTYAPSSGTSTPPPTYNANLTGTGSQGTGSSIPVNVDTKTSTGTAQFEEQKATELFTGSGTISMPSIPGVNAYRVEIPADVLSKTEGSGMLTLSTDVGNITIPDNMLSTNMDAEGKKAAITIAEGDKTELTVEEKAAVGDKPLIQLALTLDGEAVSWNNSNAPVTVSIPYTPAEEELNNPENIIIWYLDGSGKLICIPNGRYDPETGTVTFSTTHFSLYAVGYNAVAFNDVLPDAWYAKPVAFISARGITEGVGGGNYGPANRLTRGEFIVMLMRAYGIEPDTNPTDNFSDAGNSYFTNYIAAAKRLGISAGIGNNMFGTDRYITRQEMFTMLYNALKVLNMLPEGNNGKPLSGYPDAGEISSWAMEAMKLLVESGTIVGSGARLSPRDNATRAQMAQILYSLLNK